MATVGNIVIEPDIAWYDSWAAWQYDLPVTGNFSSISIYCKATNSNKTVLGIYDDTGADYPNNKLIQCAEFVNPGLNAWNLQTITETLISAQKIWLVMGQDLENPRYAYHAGTRDQSLADIYIASVYNAVMPDPFPGGGAAQGNDLSMYATYAIPSVRRMCGRLLTGF